MPSGNKPSPWKDQETLNLAREFGFDDPAIFPRPWRSYRNKITTSDVCWLINQTYWECPKCLELVSLIFQSRGISYSDSFPENNDQEEELAYWE